MQPVHLADSEDAQCNDPDWRSIWKMRINEGLDPSADVLLFSEDSFLFSEHEFIISFTSVLISF